MRQALAADRQVEAHRRKAALGAPAQTQATPHQVKHPLGPREALRLPYRPKN